MLDESSAGFFLRHEDGLVIIDFECLDTLYFHSCIHLLDGSSDPQHFLWSTKGVRFFSIQLKLQKKHIRHLYHKNAKNQFGGASPLVNPAENTIEHVSVLMEIVMVSTGM